MGVKNYKTNVHICYFYIQNTTLMSQQMDSLGARLIKLRKDKKLSQSELAKYVGVSYAQIGRYETKGAQPPAEVLNKIADILDTTVDFLINGTANEKAKNTLKDAQLLQQFQAIEQMDEEDKSVIKKLIDAFITKNRLKQIML